MRSGFPNFKPLGADCEIYVRQISPQRTESRLISNIRKVSRASAGFVVDLPYAFPVHTLVEMDVKFPGQAHYYRCRGLVEWHTPGNHPEKPHQLGIRVMSMEKLDPAGFPMTQQRTQRRPAVVGRVSKKAESPLLESKAAQSVEKTVSTPPSQVAAPAPVPPKKHDARTTELKIPKAREVSEILTSLIGEKIEVSKAKNEIDVDDIAVVGIYKDETGRILSLVGTDIALANWLGAALAMIPKEVAKKDIESQTISDETRENTQEIFNINTSVLNGPGLPHHKFVKLYNCFDNEQPAEANALMNDPVARVDFTAEVPGYGAGRVCYLFNEWHPREETAVDDNPQSEEAGPSLAHTRHVTPEALDKSNSEIPPIAAEAAEAAASYTINPPKAREIADLFTNLVGEAVTVDKLQGDPLDEDSFAAIGSFVTDDEKIIVLCAMDIKLANWSAAALAMIPKDVARVDIDNWKLSAELRDNVQEILNIAASIFNKPGMPHLRFDKLVVTMDGDPPAEYRPVLSNPSERVDFTVKIPGYGEGTMACLFLGP